MTARPLTQPCSSDSLRCWRTRSVHVTASTSPNKLSKAFFNKTGNIDFSIKTEATLDLPKKSVCDLRYYLQIYKKRMRTALISKNF